MKITEIMVKCIDTSDGKPSVTCWVRTDRPYPNPDGETEFGCAFPFPAEGQSPVDAAETLRLIAASIESMSFRPRPTLVIV